jgi:hypothetical protein
MTAWLDDDGAFRIGKHCGELVEDVARSDENYLWWILNEVESIEEDERSVIEAHLYRRGKRRRQ